MTDSLNPFHAGRFGEDELPEALRTFAALKLRNKVCALADRWCKLKDFWIAKRRDDWAIPEIGMATTVISWPWRPCL